MRQAPVTPLEAPLCPSDAREGEREREGVGSGRWVAPSWFWQWQGDGRMGVAGLCRWCVSAS